MKPHLIFIIAILLLGCTGKNQQSDSKTTDNSATLTVDTTQFEYKDYQKLESYLSNAKVSDSSFEVVEFDCAILVYPTERQIDEMKKETGEDDFYTIADDCQYYQGVAIGIIDSIGIKTITASKQFLRLKGNDKTWDLDIRKKNLPAWNIIFFKTTKEPKIISTIDLTAEQAKRFFEID